MKEIKELVPVVQHDISGEKQNAVNARDLWKFLGSKQEFANWIKNRIRDYGFEDGVDFLTNLSKSHGRPTKNYIISIDMAKELAMVENNEQGRKARRYFIEVEKQFRAACAMNSIDSASLLTTLYMEMEKRIAAENEAKRLRDNLARLGSQCHVDNFGKVSPSTGLPMDMIVGSYAKSSAKPHAPQMQKYVQCYLPMLDLVRGALLEIGIETEAR